VILFLSAKVQLTAWHRMTDAVEVWHFSPTRPLQLRTALSDSDATRDIIVAGHAP
jgi:predicted cupin superfamily sugar epimerase